MILLILTIIAFGALVGGLLLFRHNGKRSIFNIDLIQFVYLFIVAPLLFVWAKTFLFYLVRNELTLSLSVNEIFIIDTAFSIIALYVIAATSIHSLTKTFWLRRRDNPDFDLYHLSEYFHLWWSHIAVYLGIMVLLSFVSITNLFIPTPLSLPLWQFLGVPVLGMLLGLIAFITIWLSNPQQKQVNFLRVMKLLVAGFFVIHAVAYVIIHPSFSITYGLYWFVFGVFLSAGVCSFFIERTSKADDLFDFLKHLGWGNNIELFASRDK